MICPSCKLPLPDDSTFCQYCGSKIIPNDVEIALLQHNTTSSTCLADSKDNADFNSQQADASVPVKKHFKAGWFIATICLSILLLTSIVYLFITEYNNAQKVEELNSTISDKNTLIKNMNADLTALRKEVSSLEKQADNYNTIINTIKYRNLGYAADNFQSSEACIVVGLNEKNRQFTLTANWPNGGTVTTKYDKDFPSAYVHFDQDTWSKTTTLTIEPKRTGLTVVTFSNNVNSQTFNVIIIVE